MTISSNWGDALRRLYAIDQQWVKDRAKIKRQYKGNPKGFALACVPLDAKWQEDQAPLYVEIEGYRQAEMDNLLGE